MVISSSADMERIAGVNVTAANGIEIHPAVGAIVTLVPGAVE
jgi:hypothetical protein